MAGPCAVTTASATGFCVVVSTTTPAMRPVDCAAAPADSPRTAMRTQKAQRIFTMNCHAGRVRSSKNPQSFHWVSKPVQHLVHVVQDRRVLDGGRHGVLDAVGDLADG